LQCQRKKKEYTKLSHITNTFKINTKYNLVQISVAQELVMLDNSYIKYKIKCSIYKFKNQR